MKIHYSRSKLLAIAFGTVLLAILAVLALKQPSELFEHTLSSSKSHDDANLETNASSAVSEQIETSTALIGWELANQADVAPELLPTFLETFGDAVLVALEPRMWHWAEGDQISLIIPHVDKTVEVEIESVKRGLGGSRSYLARTGGPNTEYDVVVTVGDRNAFAFVGLPQGSYELVGNRDYGWLMPTASMERHVDYSKPDYVIPVDWEHSHRE